MGLNKSAGNMYEWVTHTWNTIKGKCPHGCLYCYVKRWGKQPELHLDKREFKTDLGLNNTIFIGSSCDMFADYIPEQWIIYTMCYARKFNNNYLYQTKNPERLFMFKHNLSFLDRVCTTIETNRAYKAMGNTPPPEDRAFWLGEFAFNRYLTIEPIMDFDLYEMIDLVKICNPIQVNLGADLGHNNLPEPSKDKILNLIEALKPITIIHNKKNLKRLL